MGRPRHSAPIRLFAVLFLLWVAFDFGAHGFVGPDFPPIAASGGGVGVCLEPGGGAGSAAPDHCFCHSVSIGAVVPAPAAGLALEGELLLGLPPQAPRPARRSLDRPPQLPA